MLAAAVQLWRFSDIEFAVDDAWISFRIARNWLEAGVLTYNLDDPPVEGMTNLSWTLLSAGWLALAPGLDPIVPARVLGGVLHLGAVGVLVRLAARLGAAAGGSALRSGLVTLAVLVAPGWLAYHALSGLETALFGLLFAVAIERAHAFWQGSRGAGWAAGAALALLAATRPEGVLVAALFCAWGLASRPLRARALPLVLPCVVAVAALEAFRLHTYGALVPNTFHAKPASAGSSTSYLVGYLSWGLGLVGVAPAVLAAKASRFARDVLLLLLALTVATALTGSDWMPGFRRYALVTLGLSLLAGAGIRSWTTRAGKLGLAAVALWVASNVGYSLVHGDGRRVVSLEMTQLGQRANRTPGLKSAALSDIGIFGWYFRGHVHDLYGLVDATVAAGRGVHGAKEWNEAYFLSRAPDLVILRAARSSLAPGSRTLVAAPNEDGLRKTIEATGLYAPWMQLPLGENGVWSVVVLHRLGAGLPMRVWGPPNWQLDWPPGR